MISIVIPVYNVREYILKCLDSVAAQTYIGAMECLIIDDCGQDDSIRLAEEYIASYNGDIKFRIVSHNHNRGLSAARNTGVREAKGEWIYFLDSDDWIIPECIQHMVECTRKYPNAEMVQGGAFSNDESYTKWLSIENKSNFEEYYADIDTINKLLLKQTILVVTAWNKLIRRDIILEYNLFFEEGALNEDEMWSFLLSKYLKFVVVCKKNTYYYNVRCNSIVQNKEKIEANYPRILEYLISYVGGKYKQREVSRITHLIFRFEQFCHNLEERQRYKKIKLGLIKKAGIKQSIELFFLFFGSNRIKHKVYLKMIDKYELMR